MVFLLCFGFWDRACYVFPLFFLLVGLSRVSCTLLGGAWCQAGWIELSAGSVDLFWLLYASVQKLCTCGQLGAGVNMSRCLFLLSWLSIRGARR